MKITPQTILTARRGNQSRLISWSELAHVYIGAKNIATLQDASQTLSSGLVWSMLDANGRQITLSVQQ